MNKITLSGKEISYLLYGNSHVYLKDYDPETKAGDIQELVGEGNLMDGNILTGYKTILSSGTEFYIDYRQKFNVVLDGLILKLLDLHDSLLDCFKLNHEINDIRAAISAQTEHESGLKFNAVENAADIITGTWFTE